MTLAMRYANRHFLKGRDMGNNPLRNHANLAIGSNFILGSLGANT